MIAQQILEHLNKHLNLNPSIIGERFKFPKRDQRANKSVLTYVAALRTLSMHCNLVIGLCDQR